MFSVKGLFAGLAPVATAFSLSCSDPSEAALLTRAGRVHEDAIVVDAHAHPKPGYAPTLILGKKTGTFELDFITMKEGGLDAVFFSAPLLGGPGGIGRFT